MPTAILINNIIFMPVSADAHAEALINGMYTYLDTAGALGTVIELLESFDPNGEPR